MYNTVNFGWSSLNSDRTDSHRCDLKMISKIYRWYISLLMLVLEWIVIEGWWFLLRLLAILELRDRDLPGISRGVQKLLGFRLILFENHTGFEKWFIRAQVGNIPKIVLIDDLQFPMGFLNLYSEPFLT